DLTGIGLNLPLKRKSEEIISAISAGAEPGPFHLKGTTAIGRALSTPSSITILTSAKTCVACTNRQAIANIQLYTTFLIIRSLFLKYYLSQFKINYRFLIFSIHSI